jgi:hypothetical protein
MMAHETGEAAIEQGNPRTGARVGEWQGGFLWLRQIFTLKSRKEGGGLASTGFHRGFGGRSQALPEVLGKGS